MDEISMGQIRSTTMKESARTNNRLGNSPFTRLLVNESLPSRHFFLEVNSLAINHESAVPLVMDCATFLAQSDRSTL